MAKGIDLVGILEWAAKQGKSHTVVHRREEGKKAEVNLIDLMNQKQREADAIRKYLEDQSKLNKKEDKPGAFAGWSANKVAMFLIATTPITGPLYVWWFHHLLG